MKVDSSVYILHLVNIQWEIQITKENCIKRVIALSKWTMVIICLKFTYLGCYTVMPV